MLRLDFLSMAVAMGVIAPLRTWHWQAPGVDCVRDVWWRRTPIQAGPGRLARHSERVNLPSGVCLESRRHRDICTGVGALDIGNYGDL